MSPPTGVQGQPNMPDGRAERWVEEEALCGGGGAGHHDPREGDDVAVRVQHQTMMTRGASRGDDGAGVLRLRLWSTFERVEIPVVHVEDQITWPCPPHQSLHHLDAFMARFRADLFVVGLE